VVKTVVVVVVVVIVVVVLVVQIALKEPAVLFPPTLTVSTQKASTPPI
jgi:hypothetical protein